LSAGLPESLVKDKDGPLLASASVDFNVSWSELSAVVIVRLPAELKDIFSVAASLAPVLNTNLVALLDELKSPSDTAAIPAATNMASVPVASSGA
jgi:hypothetical protein